MSNEQSKVVTKVVDVRHKAPDQAIHELMQAAKDGYAVTKIVTRFHHTHVYLEVSSKQIATEQVEKSVEHEAVKVETAKPIAKKTTAKTTVKKDEESEDA